jgi:hypothetical protein
MRPAAPAVFASALRDLAKLAENETDPAKQRFFINLKVILSVMKHDWDDSVVSRIGEMDALSGLLQRGAKIVAEPLSHLLRETASKAIRDRGDLRISTLDAAIDGLLRALIELHTSLESDSRPEAEVLLEDVWSFLEERTKRQVVDISWF